MTQAKFRSRTNVRPGSGQTRDVKQRMEETRRVRLAEDHLAPLRYWDYRKRYQQYESHLSLDSVGIIARR